MTGTGTSGADSNGTTEVAGGALAQSQTSTTKSTGHGMWGLVGLVGLLGLVGRRRNDSSSYGANIRTTTRETEIRETPAVNARR